MELLRISIENVLFHLSELFTYLNKVILLLGQRGSDNRGRTVVCFFTVSKIFRRTIGESSLTLVREPYCTKQYSVVQTGVFSCSFYCVVCSVIYTLLLPAEQLSTIKMQGNKQRRGNLRTAHLVCMAPQT